MGYDELNSGRFRPFAIVAVLLGLGLGLAMPVAAAVPSDTTSASKQALPSEAAKTEGSIVVAGKDKNWHNNKNWNKNWNHKNVVVVRPYRKWYKRPYYGTVVGGIALGAILGAAAYSAGPPAPNLCWYWANPAQTQGYWDYCQ